MRILICTWLSIGFISTALWGQVTARMITPQDMPFFEFVFTTMAATSGQAQAAFLSHLGLSDSHAKTVLRIAGQFQSEENILRQQAASALIEARADMNTRLTTIRSSREQLVTKAAAQMLRELGPDGERRIQDYIQKVNATLPRRAVQ